MTPTSAILTRAPPLSATREARSGTQRLWTVVPTGRLTPCDDDCVECVLCYFPPRRLHTTASSGRCRHHHDDQPKRLTNTPDETITIKRRCYTDAGSPRPPAKSSSSHWDVHAAHAEADGHSRPKAASTRTTTRRAHGAAHATHDEKPIVHTQSAEAHMTNALSLRSDEPPPPPLSHTTAITTTTRTTTGARRNTHDERTFL